ncbi:MAG: hypothetical protein IT373_31840 [Polyangiaceae bacterium]|nr:hypothetical protein [Polyangiaceae bacterium]
MALHEVGLREVLAAVAEVEDKPVFVEPGAGAVGACAELDVEGELVRGRSAAFVAPALAAHGLALEDGAVALRVSTAAGSSAPARDSRPPGRDDCPLLPFVVSGAPPAPEQAAALLDALVPEIGPAVSAEAPAPGPARRVETRTVSARGRELLRDHAALVLRTARVLVDATGGAAGAGALAAGTASGAPSAAPAPAVSTAAGADDERLALRVFFVEGFADAGPLHALGLRSGDRVLSFAEDRDVSVASAEAALAALGALGGPSSRAGARLLVERRGELVELRYDVR